MNRPVNPKGKPFTWSFSALNDFETCPCQYAAKRYHCTTVEEETESQRWGTRVHLAFEERLRDGEAFDADMPQTFESWAKALEILPGEKSFERAFAVDFFWNPVPFDSPEAYGRGIIDLLVMDGKTASIVDYKTGKKKNDETQMKVFCCFVAGEYPEVETFKYRYLWLKTNEATGGMIEKPALSAIRGDIANRVAKMATTWGTQNFPPFPSGLCRGWCAVTECIHNQLRRER